MGRRITRKQLKQDEFVSAADAFIRWFVENWRPIVAGLGAICVIIVLWWAGTRYSGARADEASTALANLVDEYEEAKREKGDLSAFEPRFSELAERFRTTAQADIARLYLARIALERQDTDAARRLLVELAERQRGNALGRVATLDLVRLRVASGQGSEVAKELEAMVFGKDHRLPRDTALYELAGILAREHDTDKAKEYFKKLVDEFPESPLRSTASQRLSELG